MYLILFRLKSFSLDRQAQTLGEIVELLKYDALGRSLGVEEIQNGD